MAVTYALAGVAAGLSGTMLTAALQNVWVLSVFALLFVLLSLSMFGFYELQLPSSLQSKLADTASHKKGGSLGGVTVMGVLSALIVGPAWLRRWPAPCSTSPRPAMRCWAAGHCS